MMMYKKIVCFVIVFCYPIYVVLTNVAATAQDYKERGITTPMSVRVFRVCVWLFVLWFLFLYVKYCFAYYVQYKIHYSPGWSAKVEKMGRSVCLAPELPFIDCSRQGRTETDNHVTNDQANQAFEPTPMTESHSQIPDRDESKPQHIPDSPFKPLSMSGKGLGRVHGVINLALAQRQRRDFVGPRSPLTPLNLKDPPNLSSRYNSVMGLALAQRQRREIIGPRAPLTPIMLSGLPDSFSRCDSVMSLALAQRQRRTLIGPRPLVTPFLLTDADLS
ncbi:uncharacterized protein LOC144635493 [Oculina patagonica]